jgi:hypothetical protein
VCLKNDSKENILTTKTPLKYFGIALRLFLNCILLFMLLFVVVIVINSVLVLTQNRHFLSCAAIAVSERCVEMCCVHLIWNRTCV